MSGPKSYVAPPRYSVNVFNGKLNEIFQLQHQVQALFDKLADSAIHDNGRRIHLDCSAFIDKNRLKLSDLVASFSIEHPGTFGQQQYDAYQRQIEAKIRQLEQFRQALEAEQRVFRSKREDYQSFCSYQNFHQESVTAFAGFQTQVLTYLSTQLQTEQPKLCARATDSIRQVQLQLSQAEFALGFHQKVAGLKATIEQQVSECEAAINKVRTMVSDQLMHSYADKSLPGKGIMDSVQVNSDPDEAALVQQQIQKILTFISTVADAERREVYRQKLTQLRQSEVLKADYFYIELHDELLQAEQTMQWQQEILEKLAWLGQNNLPAALGEQKQVLVQTGLALLAQSRIKSHDREHFMVELNQLEAKAQALESEQAVREKEKQFLKTQVIKALQSLHYQVVDGLNVVDFERESDFLFRIPDQSNYLNLRFNDDGSFLYNFLIPDDKTALSIDQTRQKLQEMETTCQEFKQLLTQLAAIGLAVQLQKEMPISENALIQVPKKHQSRIQSHRHQTASAQEAKQRYLK